MATPIVLSAAGLSLEYFAPHLQHRVCRPVLVEDRPLLDELIERMIAFAMHRNAMVLAAPQVGIYIRLAVIRPPKLEKTYVLINPEILYFAGRDLIETESSLSLPGDVTARVTRSERIVIESGTLDEPSRRMQTKHTGLEARLLQQAVDHLQGIFYINRVSHLQRDLALRKYGKWRMKVGLDR